MPLQAGSLITPPVTPGPARAWEYAYVEWIDPTGTSWPLTNPALGYWLADLDGIGSAPIALTTDDDPNGGTRVRSVRRVARIITMTMAMVSEGSPAAFLDNWRRLEAAITRTTEDGRPGELVIRRGDGTDRRIPAWYETGFARGSGDNWTWGIAPIQLYCEDGVWYDPREILITKTYQSAGSSFFAPYPRVSRADSIGDAILTNPGQIKVGLDWKILGPWSSFTAVNNITGESFELSPSVDLVLGEYIRVTTGPVTVTDQAGDDRLDVLVLPGSTLWKLDRGDTPVTFTMVGGGAGAGVEIRFKRWYKMP